MSEPDTGCDFLKWLVFDENDNVLGIRCDAPEEVKRAYDECARRECTKDGLYRK